MLNEKVYGYKLTDFNLDDVEPVVKVSLYYKKGDYTIVMHGGNKKISRSWRPETSRN